MGAIICINYNEHEYQISLFYYKKLDNSKKKFGIHVHCNKCQ